MSPNHSNTTARTVRKVQKPYRKPPEEPLKRRIKVRSSVRTLNKGPNFRMFDTYATPFLFDWPSRAPAWHYAGDSPRPVRKPRHCSRDHSRRPLAVARLGSGTPQTRWPAADSAPLANRDRSTGKERDGRTLRSPRTPGRTVRGGCGRGRSGGHHQEPARKAQNRPRDRGNRRLVPRAPGSAG